MFQYGEFVEAHAKVAAQGFFLRIAGVQYLQAFAGEAQAELHGAGVLLGATGAAGGRVGADGDQGDDVQVSHAAIST
ncbi:hypothetical protein D3C76_1789350 [compost metagenome]